MFRWSDLQFLVPYMMLTNYSPLLNLNPSDLNMLKDRDKSLPSVFQYQCLQNNEYKNLIEWLKPKAIFAQITESITNGIFLLLSCRKTVLIVINYYFLIERHLNSLTLPWNDWFFYQLGICSLHIHAMWHSSLILFRVNKCALLNMNDFWMATWDAFSFNKMDCFTILLTTRRTASLLLFT